MLIVEYAKYGNLRDYLRRKRPPGHVLSGSYEGPGEGGVPEYGEIINDEDSTRPLTTIDLLLFCFQTASGMEYLHSKKVRIAKHSTNLFFTGIHSILVHSSRSGCSKRPSRGEPHLQNRGFRLGERLDSALLLPQADRRE